MNIRVMVLSIFLSFMGVVAHADVYDTARKIQQDSKDVAEYQKSKMDGTYVDYSVTPTWVKIFWGVLGFAVVGVLVIGISVGRSSEKIKSEEAEVPNNPFIGEPGSATFEELGDKIKQMTISDIATATGQTDRAIKTKLIRRGLNSADFAGADSLRKFKKNGF